MEIPQENQLLGRYVRGMYIGNDRQPIALPSAVSILCHQVDGWRWWSMIIQQTPHFITRFHRLFWLTIIATTLSPRFAGIALCWYLAIGTIHSFIMLGGHLLIVLVVLWACLVVSKPVQFSKKVAVMDEKDKIVGYTSHVFFRDDEKAYPNPPVMPGTTLFIRLCASCCL